MLHENQQGRLRYLSKRLPLKVLSSENQGGSNVMSIDRYCSSVGVVDIFILFQKGHLLDFAKNIMPLLESKFLVMCEGIVEELKKGCSAFQFVKTWY